MTAKLSTRSLATAQAIAARQPFQTHGALRAESGTPGYFSGRLNETESEAFYRDRTDPQDPITYVVYSYATPIAWSTRSGRVHIVAQKFSVTTTKHQSNLYMLAQNGRRPE